VSLALQPQNVAVVDHSTPSSMKIVTQDMCAISIIEGGALRRDGGAETPCRWCYFSVQVVLTRRNSHDGNRAFPFHFSYGCEGK